MEGTILNQDLLEHDIKKVIIDSFIKGRNEIVKDCKYILDNTSAFKDQLILSHLIDNYLTQKTVEIKELYHQLIDTCLVDKVKDTLINIGKIYTFDTDLIKLINEGEKGDINILSEKDLMDIRDAYLTIITSLEEMINALRDKFIQ